MRRALRAQEVQRCAIWQNCGRAWRVVFDENNLVVGVERACVAEAPQPSDAGLRVAIGAAGA
eukprot:7973043-Pyramimonas_sp.AAC.1